MRRSVILFIIKFLVTFCVFYFGTLAVIGLSAEEGYYSPFVAKYINYIDWLRDSLLTVSEKVLSWIGYETDRPNKYDLFVKGGYGVRMVYSCIGYGVMSFWAAFIIANKGNWKRKAIWIIGGLFVLWCINILRISLLVVALNKKWSMPLGLDHHTWFNIVAYSLIFLMIYLYDKSSGNKLKLKSNIKE
jgi:exosortase/archaeosortase family protein